MSAPNDAPGMEIDLLKGSTRSFGSRVLLAQETWIALGHPGARNCRIDDLIEIRDSRQSPQCLSERLLHRYHGARHDAGHHQRRHRHLGRLDPRHVRGLARHRPQRRHAAASIGILVTLAVGIACGAFNGAIIAYIRLPPFIVTLATLVDRQKPRARHHEQPGVSTNSAAHPRPSSPSAAAIHSGCPTWSMPLSSALSSCTSC